MSLLLMASIAGNQFLFRPTDRCKLLSEFFKCLDSQWKSTHPVGSSRHIVLVCCSEILRTGVWPASHASLPNRTQQSRSQTKIKLSSWRYQLRVCRNHTKHWQRRGVLATTALRSCFTTNYDDAAYYPSSRVSAVERVQGKFVKTCNSLKVLFPLKSTWCWNVLTLTSQ